MALKHFNPTSPGQRGLVLIDRSELYKGRPEKKLVEGLTKSGGRGGNGRIAVRFRGGGAKRLYRLVDFKRRKQGVASVVRIEYDPNRTAFIALIKYQTDGELAYILAPQRLKVGDEVGWSWRQWPYRCPLPRLLRQAPVPQGRFQAPQVRHAGHGSTSRV